MASLDYLSLSNSSRMNHYSQYSWRGLKLKPSKCRQRGGGEMRFDIFFIDLHGGSRNGIFQIKCLFLSFWSPGESRSHSSSNWPTDVRQAFVPHCQLSLKPPCLSKRLWFQSNAISHSHNSISRHICVLSAVPFYRQLIEDQDGWGFLCAGSSWGSFEGNKDFCWIPQEKWRMLNHNTELPALTAGAIRICLG